MGPWLPWMLKYRAPVDNDYWYKGMLYSQNIPDIIPYGSLVTLYVKIQGTSR